MAPLLLLAACTPATSPPPRPRCAAAAPPTVRLPDSAAVRLVRVLDLSLTAPTEVELWIDGEAKATFPPAQQHALPLLGLRADTPHEAEVRWTCEDGSSGVAGPVAFDLQPPEAWPDVEVLADLQGRTGGPTLVTLRSDDGANDLVAVLDDDGAPLWLWRAEDRVVDARLEPDGTVWTVVSGEVVQLDLLGDELARFSAADDPAGTGVRVDGVGPFHHEVVPTSTGFLSLAIASVDVDAYPLSTADPDGAMAPATLEDALVVEVDRQGGVTTSFRLSDVLDTTRIGWGSMGSGQAGLDWVHANAVAIDPVDDDIVVGVRHQSAVLELDRGTGALEWILSTEDGWREPWASKRLVPVGPLDWPYQAHAPMPLPDGGLLLFDNGNDDRTTPYAGTDDGDGYYSRLVEYEIDEEAGTVSQRWELVDTTTGPLYSSRFGDADLLDDGNRLGVYGTSSDGARLVEASPDGTVQWELRLPGPWTLQRAQRISDLY